MSDQIWQATREIPLVDKDGNVVAYMEPGEYFIPATVAARMVGDDLLRKINENP